jgi:hypothetical protein
MALLPDPAKVSKSIGGMDGDGVFTFVTALILVAVGVGMIISHGRWVIPLAVVGIVVGVVGAGVAIYDIVSIKKTVIGNWAHMFAGRDTTLAQAREFLEPMTSVSVQYGLLLAVIGGLVGLLGAAMALARRSVTPGTEGMRDRRSSQVPAPAVDSGGPPSSATDSSGGSPPV